MSAIGEFELSNIPSVTAGQTTAIDLPAVGTVHGLEFNYQESAANANQATMEAGIDKIRLFLNNRMQWQLTSQQLIDWNALWGESFVTGFLHLPFYPAAADKASRLLLPWGMANVDSFRVEIDVNSGATAPSLTGVIRREEAESQIGAILKMRDIAINVTKTGDHKEDRFGQAGEALVALDSITGDADDFEFVVDDVTKTKTSFASHHRAINARPNMAVVSGHATYLPPYGGDIVTNNRPLFRQSGQKLRAEMTWTMSAATPFNTLGVFLGAPS